MYSHTLNLLPHKEQRRRKTDLLNYYTLVAGIATVTGALVMAGLLLIFDQVYKANLTSLQAEQQLAEAQAAEYLDVEKDADQLALQLGELKKAEGETTRWAALVSALRSLTPDGVSIKTVKFQGQQTGAQAAQPGNGDPSEITGVTESRRALGQFQLALAQSPFIKEAQILNTTREGKVIRYTVGIKVNTKELEGSQS
ncbi:MAG TPA: PilN domain-containing protein [Patescibacteria group bacterium]|jgi:Tfp pilus assembly protein PilN